MPETQADALSKQLRRAPTKRRALQPNAPRVIIPSALQLTRMQEERMLEHAKARHETLVNELGRLDYSQPNWVAAARGLSRDGYGMPFLAQRFLAHLVYQGRMEFRPDFYGGIWTQSNLHLPLARRITQQQVARAVAYYFGTAPWFHASPVGKSDRDFADKTDRWAKFCAEESKIAAVMSEALSLAFIQGEQVVKTAHESEISYYETFAEIAFGPDGQPFMAQDGDYIFRSDKWQPKPVPAMDPATGAEAELPPPDPATAPKFLARDGQTPLPAFPLEFRRQKIRRKVRHFSGARARCLHYMDILIPLNAPDVQRADIVQELASEPVIALIDRLVKSSPQWGDYNGLSPQQQYDRLAELSAELMPGTGETQRAASADARPELNESRDQQGRDPVEPEISTVTSWMHYDVNNDGVLESICLITDRDFRVPIHYAYAAEVAKRGQRPYRVVRVNPVPGRWHGQGQVETFYSLQHNADLLLNRWNFAQMSSARVDFWAPQLTVEGEGNRALKLNWGKTYTKKDPNTPAGQILESVYLREIKGADLNTMLQLIIQMMTNMGGVANANDAAMAGLDTSELATGVRNIQQSGEELFGKFITETKDEIRDITQDFLELTLAHFDAPRAFRYFEYDPTVADMVLRVGEMSPEEVRDLALDISLELTRYKAQTDAAQGEAAWKVATEFYAQMPEVQQHLRPLAIQRLKAHQVSSADQIIQPLMPVLPEPAGAPAAPPPADQVLL